MPFVPSSRSLTGSLYLPVEPQEAFPLFSPEGERSWVPGWEPEILYPLAAKLTEGQIFRTREEHGEGLWVVARLNHAEFYVRYNRFEPGRYAATIEVGIIRVGKGSEVTVTYSFVGLSERGNKDIEAMSQAAYDEKLTRWSQWLMAHISKHEE
jgi:hypothetical protein